MLILIMMLILPMIIMMMMMLLIMMKKKNLHSERDGDIHFLLNTTFYDVSMFLCFIFLADQHCHV